MQTQRKKSRRGSGLAGRPAARPEQAGGKKPVLHERDNHQWEIDMDADPVYLYFAAEDSFAGS